jgi:divalent metal cation (Fe/Co/Zn/Cd) transporter
MTGWNRLDPLVAIGVAINILWTGYGLLRRSAAGLMDPSVPQAQRTAIRDILARHEKEGIEFHAVRTRQAAGRAFVTLHVLVPGAWTVQRGHDLADAIEREIREALPRTTVTTHLEPLEDPASHSDTDLNG